MAIIGEYDAGSRSRQTQAVSAHSGHDRSAEHIGGKPASIRKPSGVGALCRDLPNASGVA
jgi:hypothetical protein